MTVCHLSDTVDCLYDTYCYQTKHLISCGFTREEAFHIHFASVSFMPWSEQAQTVVPLSHILRFYTHIYRSEVILGKDTMPKSFINRFLKSRFDLIYALAKQSYADELVLESALDIGRYVLPHANDTYKCIFAGIFIMNAVPVSQRVRQCLPLGRLVFDIDENYGVAKPQRKRLAAVL